MLKMSLFLGITKPTMGGGGSGWPLKLPRRLDVNWDVRLGSTVPFIATEFE